MTSSLTPSELRAALDTSEPLAILDIRDSLDYVQGHLPECTPVSRGDLELRLPTLVPNRATPVVLCDQSSDRASRDAEWIETLGYEEVSVLGGGVDAWSAAGLDLVEAVGHVHATALNYTSKRFGEEVDVTRSLPKVTPDELAAMRESGDVAVVDVRNPEEYERWGTIPGSTNVEGVDLAGYAEAVREEGQSLVVHCAGRTRSIIGTATLDALGIEDVYELENGTMGWQLAGYELAPGDGSPTVSPDPEHLDRLRESVETLLGEAGIPRRTPAEVADLRASVPADQSVYLIDVRREAEYDDGHLPGATWVAGGQLIQTAEAHLAVRTAEVVLVSETHRRAGITAYWLSEMGFPNVSVLDGGVSGWQDDDRPLVTGSDDPEPVGWDRVRARIETVEAEALAARLEREEVSVVDIDDPERFVDAHVPGAQWTARYDLDADIESGGIGSESVVLTCRNGVRSTYAAAAIEAVGVDTTMTVLAGGLDAWRAADLPLAQGDEGMVRPPRTAERKPYGQGVDEMRQYLAWEEGLVEHPED